MAKNKTADINLPDVKDIPGQEVNDADVTATERRALEDIDNREADTVDEVLSQARLDDVDDDGDPLNEDSFGDDVSGKDLDVPGSEEDDYDEEIGEEDEENNAYSIDENDHDIPEDN